MNIGNLAPKEKFVIGAGTAPEQTPVFQVLENPDSSHNAVHVGFLATQDPTIEFGDGAKVFVNPSTEIHRV